MKNIKDSQTVARRKINNIATEHGIDLILSECNYIKETSNKVDTVKNIIVCNNKEGLNSNLTITKFGTKIYTNKNGEWHRLDGPAVEYADGHKEWWKDGLPYREDGPLIEYSSGVKLWYTGNKYCYSEEDFNKEIEENKKCQKKI